MSKRSSIWLVPKRSSIHQIIGLVEAALVKNLSGKVFKGGQQEALATEMRRRGLTQGRNLSQQSVRTLLANGPQFLGFVFKRIEGNATKLYVTKAGEQLAAEQNLGTATYSSLSAWETSVKISSDLVLGQLMKLLINNPVTRNSGNFQVFPFRLAIRLTLELGYLDQEELGYLVFSTTNQTEFDLILKRIQNFRSLTVQARKSEIEAYKKTEAGNLSLVKAPSASYFMNICVYSGIFEIEPTATANAGTIKSLVLKDIESATQILSSYTDDRVYDFGDDLQLWIDYIGNPAQKSVPNDYLLGVESGEDGEYLLEILENGVVKHSMTFGGKSSSWTLPLFEDQTYEASLHSSSSDKPVTKTFSTSKDLAIDIVFNPVDKSNQVHFENSLKAINHAIQEVSISGWDARILRRMALVKRLRGRDHMNNRTKGGRLEHLFALLLKIAETEGRIDSVNWFGGIGVDGMPGPAPGGANGNPDIVFELDDLAIVLELTTIRGTAAQWSSSEAASVPDHINSYRHHNIQSKVVGIFAAPSINRRVESNFQLHALNSGVPIVCMPITDFAELLSKPRNEMKKFFESRLPKKSIGNPSP
jgi:hypothetical protein